MTDIDPKQAAQMAQNTEGVEQMPAADSADRGGRGSSIIDRLFDGNAQGPQKDELVRDYALEDWSALVLRGVLRAAPGDGMPPLGDISLGGFLGLKKYTAEPQNKQSKSGDDKHMTEFEEEW